MELISIISYSLVILIALLVVFILLSYLVSSVTKKKDVAKTRAEFNYQPVAESYNTPVVDNINIRREVEDYYESNSQHEIVFEENSENPRERIVRKKKKPVVREEERYLVLNNDVVIDDYYSSQKNKPIDIENFSNNYEDSDEGVYYNIKIGA